MGDILVSISCLTYNHAEYLRSALDGFINQRTSFEYEIVIHDDCSTDGTVEILKEYEKRYPKLFRVFYEDHNTYSAGELGDILHNIDLNETRGKYIAYCEGDDYWIDNNKLQIQIDYMEYHPDCMMTGHNVLIKDMKKGIEYPMDGFERETEVSTEEIILNNRGAFQTSSFVLRKDIIQYHIQLHGDCTIADWPLKLVSSACGSIYYFDRVMSVYRYCHNGAWSDEVGKNSINHMRYRINMVRYFDRFDLFTGGKYSEMIENQKDAFLSSVVSFNRNVSDSDFDELCSFFVDENVDNASYVRKLKEKRVLVDKEDKKMVEFINKYKHIFVMGAGQYAEELFQLLKEKNIDFDGFVISNNQPLRDEYCGKKVYHLEDICYLKENVGILIGIKKNLKDIIEKSLKSNGIVNYYWPML